MHAAERNAIYQHFKIAIMFLSDHDNPDTRPIVDIIIKFMVCRGQIAIHWWYRPKSGAYPLQQVHLAKQIRFRSD
jgi:hypothetical protein